MSGFLLLLAVFQATPPVVPQGGTVRVETTSAAVSARMDGRTVRIFPQAGGAALGLMPVPADAKPGAYTLEFLDAAGKPLHTSAITVHDARFPVQNIVLGKETAALKPAPGEMESVVAFRKNVTDTRFWTEPLGAPVAGCMNSRFGLRRMYNGRATGNYHSGVDQRSPAGAPIHTVAAGVVQIGRMFNLHGGTVAIDHGQGLQSIYLHMSGFAVKEGATVARGEVIGYVGSTGRSTAPHLHWNLYVNGVAVNPLQWVKLKPCAAPGKKQ